MKKTTVRLDNYIHTVLARLAKQRGVSLNHLINYALVRFVSFEEAFEVMENRASRGHSGALKKALDITSAQEQASNEAPRLQEDQIPPDFDRQVFEQRITREAMLHRS